MTLIYKIISRTEWAAACAVGEFVGAEIDLADGFIHFSAAEQVRETANKHFTGRSDLLLLSVDCDRLGDAVKWEPSRGGDLFPHLYDMLQVADVMQVDEMSLNGAGQHVFPASIPN